VSLQVRRDDRVVADEDRADRAREPLVAEQDPLLGQTPATAGPLHAVHVDDVGNAQHTLGEVEHAGVVAEGEADVTGLAVAEHIGDGPTVEGGGAEPSVPLLVDEDPLDALPLVGGGASRAG
jgi:hypothetical protein